MTPYMGGDVTAYVTPHMGPLIERVEGPSMDTETRALGYAELADRLGIALKSAKARARRSRWQRITGNDGKTLVQVPIDVLGEGAMTPDVGGDVTPHVSTDMTADTGTFVGGHVGGDVTPAVGPIDPPEFTILRETIARLKARLEAEQRRSTELMERRETDLAAMEERREGDLNALRALLVAERERCADLRVDRDRWVEMAARRGLLARLFGRTA